MTVMQLFFLFVLLGISTLGIAVLAIRSFRRQVGETSTVITAEMNAAIDRLGSATENYVELHAVKALTEQFTDNPELLGNLRKHSHQVVGAALFLRVNALGGDIDVVQDQLSRARQQDAMGWTTEVESARNVRLSAMLEKLRQELRTANQAVQQFSKTSAVS